MNSPSKPQLKWHGWVVVVALALATLNCVVSQTASLIGPPEGRAFVYWPFLLTATQWSFYAPLGLSIILIVAALGYAHQRLQHSKPERQATAGLVVVVTLVAVAVPVCSFSLMLVNAYSHIDAVSTGQHLYFLGYQAIEELAGDYVVCRCDSLGLACSCHYIRNPEYDPAYATLRLNATDDAGIQFFRGEDLLYTWPGDQP